MKRSTIEHRAAAVGEPAARPLLAGLLALSVCGAHAAPPQEGGTLGAVVVTANRVEQRRFDVPGAIDAVDIDTLRAATPLVNMSELPSAVPGLQVRERQNYAQDLQLSVRGFGTRSTFGVRGVRILIDGIPATMPDGQGQVATASLTSAKRIEVLRGPLAQLYGNAAGGVVQIFTNDPPFAPAPPFAMLSVGAGSYGQRQLDVSAGAGTATLGGIADLMHFSTDGYRDHSAAERTQFNAKVVSQASADTTVTGVLNVFDQPSAQDPLGLTHAQFDQNPRQVVPGAITFDTRKRVTQNQAGVQLSHRLSPDDKLDARVYLGTRQVNQTLAFSGAAASSSGGVVDLDNNFHGVDLNWNHKTRIADRPFEWTLGVDADKLDQARRGFVNNDGVSGALRRDETDRATDIGLFGQAEWAFLPRWKATAGLRLSTVRLAVDDHYVNGASPDDSGSVDYRNTSPVLGIVWYASDDMNIFANVGRGFETPTLTEIAYRADGSGSNLALRPSRSVQGEIGVKLRHENQAIEMSVFSALSRDEIVPSTTVNGRAIFQNVDEVQRQGIEASWKAHWTRVRTEFGYTLLRARFGQAFTNNAGALVADGNRLPGVPQHSLFARAEYRPAERVALVAESRIESKVFVDDRNSDAAPGYAVLNLAASYEFDWQTTKMVLFGRIDNALDKQYAGSVIVNDGNQRYFEPAAGRRLFVGVRSKF